MKIFNGKKYYIGIIKTKDVNNGKYILGFGVDPFWYQSVEVRLYFVWWQIVFHIDY